MLEVVNRMPGSQLVMLGFCLTLGIPTTSVAGPPAAGNPLKGSMPAGPPTSGTIVGRGTKEGKPYAYANVILLGTRVGTQTNEDGWFRLERAPAGKQELQVQAIYCDKQSVTVSVRAGRADTLA